MSYLDDILFLFGLFYLLLTLLLWFGVLLSRLGNKMGLNSGISVVALIVMMNAFGKLEFSIGLANAELLMYYSVCRLYNSRKYNRMKENLHYDTCYYFICCNLCVDDCVW